MIDKKFEKEDRPQALAEPVNENETSTAETALRDAESDWKLFQVQIRFILPPIILFIN